MTSSEGNLELQQILLDAISEWKEVRDACLQRGSSVAEEIKQQKDVASENRKAKKRRLSEAAQEVPVDATIDENTIADKPFHRNQRIFANWTVKLITLFLNFLDPYVYCAPVLANMTKASGLEHMSKICDIRCHGEVLDRVGLSNQRQLFVNMRCVYIGLGKRARRLEFDAHGFVDWTLHANSSYLSSMETGPDGARLVNIVCTVINKSTFMPSEIIADDPGPFTAIEYPFSLKLATIKTSKDTYMLVNLFPQLSRSLVRRLSEETGTVSTMPAVSLLHEDLPNDADDVLRIASDGVAEGNPLDAATPTPIVDATVVRDTEHEPNEDEVSEPPPSPPGEEDK